MLEALRAATKQIHQDIEQTMMSHKIMDGTLSSSELQQLIAVNYLFFNEIENRPFEGESLHEFLPIRNDVLLKDMQLNKQPIPKTKYALDLDTYCESSFSGVIYVALGSSLGGSMIYKQLLKSDVLKNSSFQFYADSHQYIKIWKTFLTYIEKQTHLESTLACKAAVKSFQFFEKNFS